MLWVAQNTASIIGCSSRWRQGGFAGRFLVSSLDAVYAVNDTRPMAAIVQSCRLEKGAAALLSRQAKRRQLEVPALSSLYLKEKAREEEFPGIGFRDAAGGREAYLLGQRVAAWCRKWTTADRRACWSSFGTKPRTGTGRTGSCTCPDDLAGPKSDIGDQRLLLSPGVEASLHRLTAYADVEFPVYQRFSGNQLAASVLSKVAVSCSF
jgi:hypothetical protein